MYCRECGQVTVELGAHYCSHFGAPLPREDAAHDESPAAPGYYPDPFEPTRRRLWLGDRWPELPTDSEAQRQAIAYSSVPPPAASGHLGPYTRGDADDEAFAGPRPGALPLADVPDARSPASVAEATGATGDPHHLAASPAGTRSRRRTIIIAVIIVFLIVAAFIAFRRADPNPSATGPGIAKSVAAPAPLRRSLA